MKYTPDIINPDLLGFSDVVVFGSNTQGRHGKGLAKHLYGNHNSYEHPIGDYNIYGISSGLQIGNCGTSYAIITKELRQYAPSITLQDIRRQLFIFSKVAYFYLYRYRFLLTPIGTGLAGFSIEEIKTCLPNLPSNVILPKEFTF